MKAKIEDGGMNKATASTFAKQIKAIYPSLKVWVESCWKTGGYEVCESCIDGSYENRMAYIESCEDYLSIHA